MEEDAETSAPERASRRVNDIGTTGSTVAANVRRFRTRLGVTTTRLAEELEAAGRPILANAITKIEQGKRRVDTDDLMALATALGVTPNALLLPADQTEKYQPTGLPQAVSGNALWLWACGEDRLPRGADPVLGDAADAELTPELLKGYEKLFRSAAAPHSLAPVAYFHHLHALQRLVEPMVTLLATVPQTSESVIRAANRYSKAWADIAAMLQKLTVDLENAGRGSTPDADALAELSDYMQALTDEGFAGNR